MYLSGGVVGLQ